jgi:hypothetical protein
MWYSRKLQHDFDSKQEAREYLEQEAGYTKEDAEKLISKMVKGKGWEIERKLADAKYAKRKKRLLENRKLMPKGFEGNKAMWSYFKTGIHGKVIARIYKILNNWHFGADAVPVSLILANRIMNGSCLNFGDFSRFDESYGAGSIKRAAKKVKEETIERYQVGIDFCDNKMED